jgi:hypothetical protein
MVAFRCNVCGAFNQVEEFRTEPASCACGSNVRIRALIHLLSLELFGQSLPLPDFPRLKAVRGVGMSDKECYSGRLADRFDYTNTFYDREPRLDFTEAHPELAGTCDFILSADVLEHIAPPVERALAEAAVLLKPNGFLGVTVYCHPSDRLREHFPDLHEFRLVPLGDSTVLVNRRADGTLEVRDDLIFHGGSGATLEMREFGMTSLRDKLIGAGFREVHFLTENVPDIGVYFDADVSQPLIARKERWSMSKVAQSEMVDHWVAVQRALGEAREHVERLEMQMRMAASSRWVQLGRRLGVGPQIDI